MANELDEMNPITLDQGKDVRVIAKQLPVTIKGGTKVFDVIWWIIPPVIGGVIWSIIKAKAKASLQKLQQKIQHDASQIDNYLEQRVQILKNCAKLVDKAIDLDKDTFTKIAAYRSGITPEADNARNEYAGQIEEIGLAINRVVENYPDLKAHRELADAMQQNSYLQREITAAREVYNDTVNAWNSAIFSWPTKQIIAAKEGYTTRIPFCIDNKTREEARGDFF
ncbi:MAG: LemA family protein [Clostridia bacterium]|nr:LemA family protein [Clostridia bacterium]MDE7329170.1 LemA family protein [Clostridia bacterium]